MTGVCPFLLWCHTTTWAVFFLSLMLHKQNIYRLLCCICVSTFRWLIRLQHKNRRQWCPITHNCAKKKRDLMRGWVEFSDMVSCIESWPNIDQIRAIVSFWHQEIIMRYQDFFFFFRERHVTVVLFFCYCSMLWAPLIKFLWWLDMSVAHTSKNLFFFKSSCIAEEPLG